MQIVRPEMTKMKRNNREGIVSSKVASGQHLDKLSDALPSTCGAEEVTGCAIRGRKGCLSYCLRLAKVRFCKFPFTSGRTGRLLGPEPGQDPFLTLDGRNMTNSVHEYRPKYLRKRQISSQSRMDLAYTKL